MRGTAVAQRYSKALLDSAESQGVLDQITRDVAQVIDLIDRSDDFKGMLQSPMIHPNAKREAITTIFKGRVAPLMLNFLLLLVDRRRERVTEEILGQFNVYLDEREGVVTAEVTSSRPITPDQEAVMVSKFSTYLNRKIRLKIEVSPQIRAGFVARMGDLVFDGTIETQLKQLKTRMMGI